MIEILLAIMCISFAVERIVGYLFDINFLKTLNKKTTWIPMKKYSAIIVGILVAFQANIDFINLILTQAEPSTVGFILTGLLIAGGSNLINDMIKKIGATKKEIK